MMIARAVDSSHARHSTIMHASIFIFDDSSHQNLASSKGFDKNTNLAFECVVRLLLSSLDHDETKGSASLLS